MKEATKMERARIETILREILVKRVPGLKPESILPESELATLGVDSLAYSWILADVEDSFDIVMLGADSMKLNTLSAAADYVEAKIGR
jgi:acyl carrier protein